MPVTADTVAGPTLLVDAREATRLCGVGRSTWLALRSQGRVPPAVHLGRRTLWRRADLERWVAAGCPAGEQLEGPARPGAPR